MNIQPLSSCNQEISFQLSEYMEGLSKCGYFNGAVLVARHGQILLRQGYGMANFEHEVRNSSSTKFRIGSIAKSFTAVAILQLQEKKMLHVNDCIGTYLPNYPNGSIITIHHLLSHSSGIPDFTAFADYWGTTMKLFSPLEETMRLFRDRPLEFEPGEDWRYTSSSYILLSAIIEKVSGVTYGAYIFNNICRPLGMNDTGVEEGRTILKHFASGYSVCKDIIPAEYVDMSLHLGAGGMYSTVEDLYLWDRTLYTDTLVGQASRDMMFSEYTPYCGSYGWVVGSMLINHKSRKRIGHVGSMNGFVADMNRYTDDDLVVITLSNINMTPIGIINDHLAKIALGESLEGPKPVSPIQVEMNEMQRYVGVYVFEGDMGCTRSIKGNTRNLIERIATMDAGSISVGRFYKLFDEYGIDNRSSMIVTCEQKRLYLFMPKNHGAWFKYELVPIARQIHSTVWIAKNIDEKIVFNIEQNGSIRLIHTDVQGIDRIASQVK